MVGNAEVMAQIGSAGITSGLPVIRSALDLFRHSSLCDL
jgi:hypothetical protein